MVKSRGYNLRWWVWTIFGLILMASASYGYTVVSDIGVITNNVTADYYIGDGRYLTNLPNMSQWIVSGNNIYSKNSGSVGIGTSNPAAKLSVVGNSNNGLEVDSWASTVYISTYNRNSSLYTPMTIRASNFSFLSGGNTQGIFQASSGYVGIGTLAPNQNLVTIGTVNFTNASNSIGFFQTSDANVGIGTASPYGGVLNIVRRSAYNNENIGGLAIDTGVNGESKMVLGADPVNNITYIQSLARLTSYLTRPLTLQPNGGSVGIGTTSPNAQLHIQTTSAAAAGQGLVVENNQNQEWAFMAGVIGQTSSGASIYDVNNNAVRMAFTNTGNVGIGTTSPANKFHVSGAGSSSGIAKFQSTDANGGFIIINDSNTNFLIGTGTTMGGGALANSAAIRTATGSSLFFNEGTTNRMVINAASGYVGIGTSTPADKLTVVGDVNVSGCYQLSDGTLVGGSCASSRDYKMNEKIISIDWNKFNSVKPKTYKYKQSEITIPKNRTYQKDITKEVTAQKSKEVPIESTNETTGEKYTKTQIEYYNETTTEIIGSENVTEFYNETLQLDSHGYGFIYEDVAASYPDRVTIQDGVKKVNYGFDWVLDNRAAIQELRAEMDAMKAELCALGRAKYC